MSSDMKMLEEIVRKIKEYDEKIKSAKNLKEILKYSSEIRVYLEGIADSTTDSLSRNMLYLLISDMRIFEYVTVIMDGVVREIDTRLSELEKRIKKIEDELEFREKYI
jgi:uncharacterized protein YaaR (DUF327 family)